MARPAFVLDTNTFNDRRFLGWCAHYRGEKILPAVAYTELGVYFHERDSMENLWSLLDHCGVVIEWYRVQEAERAVQSAVEAGDFRKNARDHMIAGHVYGTDRVLITRNGKDFAHVGRTMTPEEAMECRS